MADAATDAPQGPDARSDPGTDGPPEGPEASCLSAEVTSPTLNLWDAITGAPICDPTFSVLAVSGVNGGGVSTSNGQSVVLCGATPPAGCPTVAPDGGTLACTFAVLTQFHTTVTIGVSAPGYATATVPGLASGLEGCVVEAASHADVMLTPVAVDAGGSD